MTQLLRIILDIFTSLLELVFQILCDIAVAAVPAKRKQKYDAEFGKAVETLEKNGEGFYIGTWSTSLKASNNHAITIGASGSHKSTSTCFPQLLQAHAGSYVIHDCAREMYQQTSQPLHNAGYKIKILDYGSDRSEAFNVLAKCKSEEDITKAISTLLSNSFAGNPDYWTQSAETITSFFAKALWRHAPSQYVTIPNVLHMLHVFSYGAEEYIDPWIVRTADSQIINEYKSIAATPTNTLMSTLSTAKTALSIFTNANIQKLTSFDTIDFEEFRRTKVALFICNSPGTAHYYRSISASLIQSFFNHILEKLPLKTDLNITFLIDEASIMRLNSLSSFLSLSRKYRVSVQTLWQDYNQIEQIYGKYEASNIFSNSQLKSFMPGAKPMETCVMLEKLLGKYSVIAEDSVTEKSRELLTAQEIYQLKKILVLNGNQKPLLLPVEPHFSQPKLKKLIQLYPFEIQSTLPDIEPPILQFG